jgi:hypothetical protein
VSGRRVRLYNINRPAGSLVIGLVLAAATIALPLLPDSPKDHTPPWQMHGLVLVLGLFAAIFLLDTAAQVWAVTVDPDAGVDRAATADAPPVPGYRNRKLVAGQAEPRSDRFSRK